jgi:hypothetical protein
VYVAGNNVRKDLYKYRKERRSKEVCENVKVITRNVAVFRPLTDTHL